MKYICSFFIWSVFVSSAYTQQFISSDLPIIIINTVSSIQDEPKISGTMAIINNGTGQINKITDAPNDFNGNIAIEYRGSTSQWFPKKPYGLSTTDANGVDINVSLLGMPKESDWVFNAAYNDKTLMRDMLCYILGGIMEYSPRGKYCELVINGEYQGVYILMEKIKRDKNRVDVDKLNIGIMVGDSLTGGYIIKIDKPTGSNSNVGWNSPYPAIPNSQQTTYFQIEYPKNEDINTAQQNYIKKHINDMEKAIAGPEYRDPIKGFRKYIDTKSLVDFIILNEISKNPDAYRLSTYFTKERDSDGGKIKFGPIWDFNLGFGNVDYCTQGNPEGLVITNFNQVCGGDGWVVHFWWNRFLSDANFYVDLKLRWKELRSKKFSDEKIISLVDSLNNLVAQAQVRNFKKWPILNEYVWPNYYVGGSYVNEISHLKEWLLLRMKWLDKEWKINGVNVDDSLNIENMVISIIPNLTNNIVHLKMRYPIKTTMKIRILDVSGKSFNVGTIKLIDQNTIEIDASMFPQGHYFVQITDIGKVKTYRFVKI
ncbi:MAG: CotH kinase family protein [Saprospiraceae bacterium]|nr:CotH kinase family protein [Saprospiraceae bacterium]